jgi:hypothetical protein
MKIYVGVEDFYVHFEYIFHEAVREASAKITAIITLFISLCAHCTA